MRVAAVEAVGTLKPSGPAFLEGLINVAAAARLQPVAEAAVRTLPRAADAQDRLAALIGEPVRSACARQPHVRPWATAAIGLLAMARDGGSRPTSEPGDDRAQRPTPISGSAARPAPFCPCKTASVGLPPIEELLQRAGKADRGEAIFFRTGANACSGCHRIQGRGRWVGPDLSTIGVKYGKDELLRSILNPSAAIGYNYRSMNLALKDGRIMTGLPIAQSADSLVLKTAEGK
ncbi:MAG: c-type cytochrome, partial [Singulisphaera sp.]